MKFVPRSEKTRQFIIETTAPIFNMKGYAGTSLSDLTEATSLTKGSIYGNFENKEEVALSAFDYNAAHRNQLIHNRISREQSCKDKLMAYATLFSSAENKAFPAGGCPLLNTGTEADDTHEPLRKRVAEELLTWKSNIETIIKQGIAAGEFKPDTNATKTALSMIALIEGAILLGRTTRNPLYLDTVLETVKDLIRNIEQQCTS